MRARDSFKDKVVVVSGAAGGIGRALAFRFGQAGARIAALDRDAAGLEALVRDLTQAGIVATPHVCDVAEPEQCEAVMRVWRIATLHPRARRQWPSQVALELH